MFFEAKMAVLDAMKPDIEALPPVERRKFAEVCRRWADLAEPLEPASESSPSGPMPMPMPASGVLLELHRGLRSEE